MSTDAAIRQDILLHENNIKIMCVHSCVGRGQDVQHSTVNVNFDPQFAVVSTPTDYSTWHKRSLLACQEVGQQQINKSTTDWQVNVNYCARYTESKFQGSWLLGYPALDCTLVILLKHGLSFWDGTRRMTAYPATSYWFKRVDLLLDCWLRAVQNVLFCAYLL